MTANTSAAVDLDADDDLLAALSEVAADAVPRDPAELRNHRDGPDGFDRTLWRRFGDLGWLSLLVPEIAGGAGADERAAAVIARALGAAGRLEPFVAAGVIVPRWLAGLDGTGATAMLESVMTGDLLVAPAWQGATGGPDTDSLPVAAVFAASGLTLAGTAHWVPIHRPDAFIVAARSGDDTVLVAVDPQLDGVTVHPQSMADGTRWARLELSDVELPAEAVLGRGAAAATGLAAGVDVAVIVVAAELVGHIEQMLSLTLDYLGTRRQFGQPIGAFQALQHKAVDLWVQQRLSEAALAHALRGRVGACSRVRARAASSAKARASSAALIVGSQAVQLHGAIGFTDDYELALHVNRALVLAAWLGNASTHTRRYARLSAEQADQ
jgi:alkylation response protein AidB-like acyl-CoA dehydrogenase